MGYARRSIFRVILLVGTALLVYSDPGEGARRKKVVGATAKVEVKEAELDFRARIDSGAEKCSIHAEDIKVDRRSEEMRRNIGKDVEFRIENEKGKDKRLRRPIQDVVRVTHANGAERRYQVYLTIEHDGRRKRVLVSLDDRADMSEKLLLGRNWLEPDYLIDVGR